MGVRIVDSTRVKEEQIWGSAVGFFTKKVHKGRPFDVQIRTVKAGKYEGTDYKLHDHGDSCEIVFFLSGRIKEYFEPDGVKEIKKGDLLIVEPHTNHGLVEVAEDANQVVFYIPGLKEGRYK
jgi:quercetin dioxygenase-like cupin family protein